MNMAEWVGYIVLNRVAFSIKREAEVGGPTDPSTVLAAALREITSLWEDGVLPFQATRTQWVAGYRVVYRHMGGVDLYPVYVGPKKPRRFNPRHVSARSFDAWGREVSGRSY